MNGIARVIDSIIATAAPQMGLKRAESRHRMALLTEKKDDSEGEPIGSGVPEDEQIDTEDETSIELSAGSVIDLAEGETANAINLGPNKNFTGFVEAVCQQIGAALEIPCELLMKHFTASYPASRGALEEAWKMFQSYKGTVLFWRGSNEQYPRKSVTLLKKYLTARHRHTVSNKTLSDT